MQRAKQVAGLGAAQKLPQDVKIYSYVVDHDEGRRPNPISRVCTLCGCECR